ncbi:MAG: alpha/beta fold hydrolase [Oscillospiraceae bacterium]|nr:alpha/beta fold hydrolase [Oscillospiraceae bacterium]
MNIIEKLYRSNLFIRNDNPNGIFYFTAADFSGLQSQPYGFKSQMGHDLKGWFYYYDNPISGRLVVFDHGMGNGHRAYLREIEYLAKAGYLVYSYDHTGCMESGGKSCNGFAQSLKDLDDCMCALEKEPALADRKIAVVGHSWGGFSTMNISAMHPQITHVVSMSGFISVRRMLEQTFSGLLKGVRKSLYALEKEANGAYADADAIETLSKTSAKVLLIASSDDKVVHKRHHFDVLQQALSEKQNIRFLITDNKGHNPSYTIDAVQYKDDFFARFQKLVKKKKLETPAQQKAFMDSFDWLRMTQQDEAVWDEIFRHLQS